MQHCKVRKYKNIRIWYKDTTARHNDKDGIESQPGRKNTLLRVCRPTQRKSNQSYRVSQKKRSLRIPAPMEALGCSKGLDISQKHCQTSFFYLTHLFETELCDSRLCGYFRLGSCGVHLPSQWITFTSRNFEQSLTISLRSVRPKLGMPKWAIGLKVVQSTKKRCLTMFLTDI